VAVADPNCSAPSLTEGDANSNGTLDAGETWTYTCTAKPTALGTFTNTVTFTVTDTEELTVSAAASATVEVTAVAADELARTGRNTGDLARLGATLIGIGALLSIRRPVGRHYRKRLPRNSRGRHFTAR
jgi:hypothetical protein